jgi:hypothetical protein
MDSGISNPEQSPRKDSENRSTSKKEMFAEIKGEKADERNGNTFKRMAAESEISKYA